MKLSFNTILPALGVNEGGEAEIGVAVEQDEARRSPERQPACLPLSRNLFPRLYIVSKYFSINVSLGQSYNNIYVLLCA